ncbi:MAG: hypothetical protein AMJ91_06320 [candidate division Zixibacteria bacterium SM23_73_3]|nr:MAG: hypothetical protein AMJ91_06320 [candidate division Zixibacteria bacterium SM23_73_3]
MKKLTFILALLALGSLVFAQAEKLSVNTDPSAFTIARLKYGGGGDWYWGSSAIPNMLKFLGENTNIPVAKEEVRVSIMDEDLFSYPFLFLTGHGNIKFTDQELERLRNYLTHGGFLFANDSFGLRDAFFREMKRLFPDKELVELPFSHGIYHCWYDFPNGLPKIHKHDEKSPQGFGAFHEGRLIVFFVYESDIGDGWEDPQVHNDPPEKREAALKMGVNIIAWALEN